MPYRLKHKIPADCKKLVKAFKGGVVNLTGEDYTYMLPATARYPERPNTIRGVTQDDFKLMYESGDPSVEFFDSEVIEEVNTIFNEEEE